MSPEELLQSTLDAADEQRLRVGQGEAGPVYARENEHAYNAFEMQDEAFVPESVALTLATELTRLRAALAKIAALQTEEPVNPLTEDIGPRDVYPDMDDCFEGGMSYGMKVSRYEASSLAAKALGGGT